MGDGFAAEAYARAADRALAAFGVAAQSIEFVRLGENITYRVRSEGACKHYVLRLHRPGYHDIAELRSERLWTRALVAAGIGAPEALRTGAGEDYVAIAIPETGETRWAGMLHWVEGEIMATALERGADLAARCDRFRALGGMFAQLHAQSAGWTAPAGFVRHHLDADGLMGDRPFWGPFWDHAVLSADERTLLLQTRDAIYGVLGRQGKPRARYSMIHADLHPENVLLTDRGLALIDFDDCAFGWHLYDLAVALGRYQHGPEADAYRVALIEGYRQLRPLPDEDLAVLPTLILARALAELGWLHQRPEIVVPPARLQALRHYLCSAARQYRAPF